MSTGVKSGITSSNDRRDAVRQLHRIVHDGAYRSLVDRNAPPRVVAMVSAVTRWRRYLTFLLHHFLKDNSRPLPLDLEQLLLLGIAEIVLLNEQPHIVVNELVNLARSMGFHAGMTNGILRSVVRAQETLPEPDTGEPVRDLAIRWSHPTWLVRRYVKRFGMDEATLLLQHNNEPPVFGIRVNSMHTSPDQFEAELRDRKIQADRSDFLEEYFRVKPVGSLIREGYLDRGVCSVHDESAGLVVALLDPQPGETVLDTCSAPGGKALAIACRMQGTGQLHAWDIHLNRLEKLKEFSHMQGLKNIHTEPVDLLQFGPEIQADRVLLDVPCSGTGVMCKRADMRWRRSREDLMEMMKLQKNLLDAAAHHVRSGGYLVYSTCSIEPEENEEQVSSFLSRQPAFVLEHAGDFLPAETVSPEGYMATLPHLHGMDGAFAARLRKRE